MSYESQSVLPPLLISLAEHEPDVPVVVVDNASPGGPPDVSDHLDEVELRAQVVDLIALADNRGYGAACNVGVRHLSELGVRYLAFLNPDIRLQGPSLTQLAEQLDALPEVGVASGPVVDEGGARVPSAFGPTSNLRALWFTSGWQSRRTRALISRVIRRGMHSSVTLADDLRIEGHVLGGAMIVRRSIFEEIGGFDEAFFLYWEDADVCERARRVGAEVRILGCTPFVHAPTSSTPGVAAEQRWGWYVSGARTFARKHLPPGQAEQLDAALSLGKRLRDIRAGAPRD